MVAHCDDTEKDVVESLWKLTRQRTASVVLRWLTTPEPRHCP
jgi:hypothetical protein